MTSKENNSDVFFDLMVETVDSNIPYVHYCSSMHIPCKMLDDISAQSIMKYIAAHPSEFFTIKSFADKNITYADDSYTCEIKKSLCERVPYMLNDVLQVGYAYAQIYYERRFIVTNIRIV